MTTTRHAVAAAAFAFVTGLAVLVSAGHAGAEPQPGGPVLSVPATGQEVAPTADGQTPSTGVAFGFGALVGLIVAGGAAGAYLMFGKPEPAPLPPTVASGPPPAAPPAYPDLSREHAALVAAVIEVRDLVDPTSVLSNRLRGALAGAGVTEYEPLGEPFDPSRHHAVDVEPTGRADVADRIATVQRVGYVDATHLIRFPEVVVYRLEPAR